MYKLIISSLLGLLLLSACGTSKEEQAADAKRKADSLAAAESAMKAAEEAARMSAMADSVNLTAVEDSLQEPATK